MPSRNSSAAVFVPGEEVDKVSRYLLDFLRRYPELPTETVRFEYLADDEVGMSLSTIQSAYKIKQYLLGGYMAEYQFKLIYRVQPGSSDVKRLRADEALNDMANWLCDREVWQTLFIGENKRVCGITSSTRATMFARYNNGTEDHQILMKLRYEVI